MKIKKNTSQEEMAKKVHANLLSRYECNLSGPSIEVVEKVAKILDVVIDELVFGSVNNEWKNILRTRNCSLYLRTYNR